MMLLKVNVINTSGFVSKTQYNIDKSNLETKIPDTSGLVKKIDYGAMITEIEGKTPSITGLTATAGLNAVENKIPNVSDRSWCKMALGKNILLLLIIVNFTSECLMQS